MNPEVILKIVTKHPELLEKYLPTIKNAIKKNDVATQSTIDIPDTTATSTAPSTKSNKDTLKRAKNNVDSVESKKSGRSLSEEYKNYGPTKGETILWDAVVPVIGDTLNVAGNAYGAYQSLLGQAILAMHENNMNTKNWTGTMGKPTAAIGAIPYQTKSILGTLIGNTAANRMYTLADTVKENNRTLRDKEFQAEHSPSGRFWESQRTNIPTKKGSAGRIEV